MIFYSSILPLISSGSATADAAALDQLYIYFLIAAAFVFLAVTGFIIYILFKYRARGEKGEPPQIHSNKKVEISLASLATALTGVFFDLSVSVMRQVSRPAQNQQADVKITAHQWWLEAEYPGELSA